MNVVRVCCNRFDYCRSLLSCLFWETRNPCKRASERDDFLLCLFFSFLLFTLESKEDSSRIRKRATTTASFTFCLGLVFRKGRAKIRIMIEGKGKASEEEEKNTTAFLFPSCNNNRETRNRQRERDSERAKVLCKIDQLSFDNRERER
jgi:hypothetical protein